MCSGYQLFITEPCEVFLMKFNSDLKGFKANSKKQNSRISQKQTQ